MKTRTLMLLLAGLAAALGVTSSAAAQAAPSVYAIEGAKIYTIAGAPIESGTVLIREGKIAAVGTTVDVPAGATVINARGLEVYPGMFDPITQMGLSEVAAVPATVDIAELGEYNPEVVAADAVNPASAHIPVARASGITQVLVVPSVGGFDFFGGGGVIGGQVSAIHLAGWTVDQMLIRRSVAMVVNWPTMETRHFDFTTFSFKERPFSEVKREYERKINDLSDWIERAQHYAQAEEKGSPANFHRDLKLEALALVVQRKLPALVVADRARDIKNAIEFCDKHKLTMILAGGGEAWKVKDLLKQKNIPVVLQPTLSLPEDEDDPYDKPYAQPAELAAAGVKIAFSSFDTSFSRRLSQDAGTAVGYGLAHDEALKAVTLYPAQIFGLDKELGTIEPGKVANVIVTTGDPLELATEVRYLFINGQLTSTDNKQRELYEEYRKRP